MKNESARDFLTSLDDLFKTQEERAQEQGITEELKASDQMRWVGLMNNIRQSAEESIIRELIYN